MLDRKSLATAAGFVQAVFVQQARSCRSPPSSPRGPTAAQATLCLFSWLAATALVNGDSTHPRFTDLSAVALEGRAQAGGHDQRPQRHRRCRVVGPLAAPEREGLRVEQVQRGMAGRGGRGLCAEQDHEDHRPVRHPRSGHRLGVSGRVLLRGPWR